jgi:hypothetical protein
MSQDSLPLIAVGGEILDPHTDFTEREADLFARIRMRDLLILADINSTANRLHDLRRERTLGFGPSRAWREQARELEAALDELYHSRRENLTRMSALLATVLKRRRRLRKAQAKAMRLRASGAERAGER